MLSYLDPIIFPNQCEVLEIAPHSRYVYPIFKNGSTSLRRSGFRLIDQNQLSAVSNIDIFVRPPWPRFLSGVQSYLLYVQRTDPMMDRYTVMRMISDCTFLNSHFSLQFHWLCNLRRFYSGRMRLLPMDQLHTITNRQENPSTPDPALAEFFFKSDKLNFYLQIDKILVQHMTGQSLEFSEILAGIKHHSPELYREVIEYSKNICNVLD